MKPTRTSQPYRGGGAASVAGNRMKAGEALGAPSRKKQATRGVSAARGRIAVPRTVLRPYRRP